MLCQDSEMTPIDTPRYVVATALFTCLLGCFGEPVCGADSVVIVVGAESPAIERFAGEELADQFRRVFEDVDVVVIVRRAAAELAGNEMSARLSALSDRLILTAGAPSDRIRGG